LNKPALLISRLVRQLDTLEERFKVMIYGNLAGECIGEVLSFPFGAAAGL